ncbi:MAG: two-component system response regulator, partial [Gemmatimonadetes bacterium]|nr:two-component system response regulator [Gemmatimonadota bacterium]NIQ53262.1 two-component system response regulator [Gemmatimonadota bacterium]NIU73401.1 two-component system response regulator [Gammaproteobacteria bacterium]NIX43628.1 two-component system response regulator [Gemmatimonadota bacterium]NIY07823.1 two-component system response regulator [Gemmatimonadota bacterium]
GARHRALTAGADDFLAKPVNSGMLLKKVRNWLGE